MVRRFGHSRDTGRHLASAGRPWRRLSTEWHECATLALRGRVGRCRPRHAGLGAGVRLPQGLVLPVSAMLQGERGPGRRPVPSTFEFPLVVEHGKGVSGGGNATEGRIRTRNACDLSK